MAKELWLLNPARTRRRRKKGARSRSRSSRREVRPRLRVTGPRRLSRRPTSPFRGWRINRRRRNPFMARARKRRRVRRRSSRRRNPFVVNYRRRSRRRGRARRRVRRNPFRRNQPAINSLLNETMYAGLGYIGTRFVSGMVLPAIGMGDNPLIKIVAKSAVAYGAAWGGSRFLGSRYFTPMFIGGMADVIQEVVRSYIAPMIPALAAGELESYYQPPMVRNGGMGSYYGTPELGAEDVVP